MLELTASSTQVAMAGDGEVKVAEKKGSEEPKSWEGKGGAVNELMDNAGVSLGPIGLTISDGLRPASAVSCPQQPHLLRAPRSRALFLARPSTVGHRVASICME